MVVVRGPASRARPALSASTRGVTVMIATHDLNLAAERFDRVMLLNGRLLGFGRSETVFTSERLLSAYGGHIRMLDTGDGTLIVNDTCCDP